MSLYTDGSTNTNNIGAVILRGIIDVINISNSNLRSKKTFPKTKEKGKQVR